MPKILTPYNGLTAAGIIAKATSGVCTMSVNGSNVDCSSITMTGIKNAITGGSFALSVLNQHANANIYSGYGPHEWYIETSEVKVRHKYPYTMGCWAGYKHNAITPSISATTTINLNSTWANDPYTLSLDVNLGEVDWSGAENLSEDYIIIKVNGVTKTSKLISDFTANSPSIVECSVTAPAQGGSTNYECQLWFGSLDTPIGRLVVATKTVTINVAIAARFANVLVEDIQANRDVLDAVGNPYVNFPTEYTYIMEALSYNKTMSASSLGGKYTMTAQIKRTSDGAYLRTIGTSSYAFPHRYMHADIYMFRTRGGVDSAEYLVGNNAWVEYIDVDGVSFTYNLPAGIDDPADGDLYYIIFRDWY